MIATSNVSIELDGKEYPVKSFSYKLEQHTDHTGQPSSEKLGGKIKLVLESSEDNFMLEWACDSFMRKDGTITMRKSEDFSKLKDFQFKEAFVTEFEESFDEAGLGTINCTISAREISMGNAVHENEWLED